MIRSFFLTLGAFATPFGVQAQERDNNEDRASDAPKRCVSPTVLVSPFNNSPGALEQSRIAATTVEAVRHGRGEAALRICKTSALAPEISEVEGVDEEPLTEEELRELDPEAAPRR